MFSQKAILFAFFYLAHFIHTTFGQQAHQQQQKPQQKKDDGRIWKELKQSKGRLDWWKGGFCVPKCQAPAAGKKKQCHSLCPFECALPFDANDHAEGHGQPETEDGSTSTGDNAAWLLPVPFQGGEVDPRQCMRPKEVPLEFAFCQRGLDEDKTTTPAEDCGKSGYVVCYESHLDPERPGPKLERKYAMENKKGNFVTEICDQLTTNVDDSAMQENLSEMQEALQNWEQNRTNIKHGFMVSQLGAGTFEVTTSFGTNTFSYGTPGKGAKCLRLRLFDSTSPFSRLAVTGPDEHFDPSLAQSAPADFSRRLVNGQWLEAREGQLLGPWLLGLDMLARYQPPVNLKLVKVLKKDAQGRQDLCVPQASFRSTLLDGRARGPLAGTSWRRAADEDIHQHFGGQVLLDKEGRTVYTYNGLEGMNEPLVLTFAVPEEDSFHFYNFLSDPKNASCWAASGGSPEDKCKSNNMFLEYNNLGQQCRLSVGRTEFDSCVGQAAGQIKSFSLLSPVEDLDSTEAAKQAKAINDASRSMRIDVWDLWKPRLRMAGLNDETHDFELSPQVEDAQEADPVGPEVPGCAVINAPIQGLAKAVGASHNFVLQISVLPASMAQLKMPLCANVVQLQFDKDFQLLVPAE